MELMTSGGFETLSSFYCKGSAFYAISMIFTRDYFVFIHSEIINPNFNNMQIKGINLISSMIPIINMQRKDFSSLVILLCTALVAPNWSYIPSLSMVLSQN